LCMAAHNLYKEVLFLVDHGFGFAAFRTSRTLYECVIFCLYMGKHPETCKSYLKTWNAHWARVIRNVSSAEQNLPEIHKTLSKKVPEYAQGKKEIPANWNDEKTTYKMAMDVGVPLDFHSLAFNYASAFVHPSPIFFVRNFTKEPGTDKPVPGNSNQDQEIKFALQVTHDLVLAAIRLRVNSSGDTALRRNLADCEKDFLRIWGYKPQLEVDKTSQG